MWKRINKKMFVFIVLILFIGAVITPTIDGFNKEYKKQNPHLIFNQNEFSRISFWVRGYVNYSDGSSIPNGIPVTVTDLNNSKSKVVYTQQGYQRPGYYLINIEDINGNDGDTILVNVSYGGCEGNNSVVVNISEQGTNVYCYVTIFGNLPPEIPEKPSGPTFGYINTTYNFSTSTWASDGEDIYYWFLWDDGNNSGWLGPYSSNVTCNVSNSWSSPGTYKVKAKAKDEHGAELGWVWSDPLNVTIVISRPPNQPSDPEPEDGATDVDIDADLYWNCSDPDGDELTYDVYFEKNDPWPDVIVSHNQSETTYDPGTMEFDTHYYWKIVAWDPYGFSTEGPIWDFITMAFPNDPPYVPSEPSPENGSIDVGINVVLSWVGGDPDGDEVVYDVYFEADDPTPDIRVADDISETFFDVGVLDFFTIYYWKIVAKDEHGVRTYGPVWHFTSVDNSPPGEPSITGPSNGVPGVSYDFVFNAVDPEGHDVRFVISWGNGEEDTTVFVSSGDDVTVSHVWDEKGTYTVIAKAEDEFGLFGPEGSKTITIPRCKMVNNFLLRFLERHPLCYMIFRAIFHLFEL